MPNSHVEREEKSSYPAPGLQIIHLETRHRKDPRWKAQVIFRGSYRCCDVKQTQLMEHVSTNMAAC